LVASRPVAAVRPFLALRYRDRAGALGDLVAPPYDVISPDERDQLLARSPFNAVRLELPDPPYEDVAAVIAEWIASGVLGRPDRPGVIAWTQTFSLDGEVHVRKTILATVGLEPYSARVVRPHERTHSGPKEDRLRLYRAVRTHISPVFGLYPDPAGAAWAAVNLGDRAPDAIYVSDDGAVENRIWWVDDPAATSAVADALADKWILIADGHHRYETALAYQAECRAAAPDAPANQPFDFVLMGLTALDDPGLVVLPTHRVLGEWPSGAAGRLDATPADTLDDLLVLLRDAPLDRPAMGLVTPDGCALLTGTLPDGATPGERLDVAVLERDVLIPDLGDDQAALAHRDALWYTKDAADAAAQVASGAAAAAVIIRPLPKDAVAAVSDAGQTMPQKSTYFYPKLWTGVAFHSLVADD
jgi:uncharacterized protein (DUF1015 family)